MINLICKSLPPQCEDEKLSAEFDPDQNSLDICYRNTANDQVTYAVSLNDFLEKSRGEQHKINDMMLDMIANTDCSWAAATAAIAFWQHHEKNNTAPVFAVTGENANVCYDRGDEPRSLKVGVYVNDNAHWYMTIQSTNEIEYM